MARKASDGTRKEWSRISKLKISQMGVKASQCFMLYPAGQARTEYLHQGTTYSK